MPRFYKEYTDFLAEIFPHKMQKITVNAGFSCPNRDGTLSTGGCIYCNNSSFSPAYACGSVSSQLEAGKEFFSRKYPHMRYLAYFQSYTGTHAPIERIMSHYAEALETPGVDGLIIGTRPDCMPDTLLAELKSLRKPVIVEFGAESAHNATLELINRCHTWQQTVDAVRRTADAGLPVGLHFIMGLPGETERMMLQTVELAARLPLSSVKFHQLQVIEGTTLARNLSNENGPAFKGKPVKIFELDEYIALCVKIVDTIQSINPEIAIDRFTSQAPASILIAPKWGLKNYQFTNLLHNELARRVSG